MTVVHAVLVIVYSYFYISLVPRESVPKTLSLSLSLSFTMRRGNRFSSPRFTVHTCSYM